MRTLVTAILVARSGGEWLEQTLAALGEQTRQPDRFIGIVAGNGPSEGIARALVDGGAQRVVTANSQLPFGEAVREAVLAIPNDASQGSERSTEPSQEWLWLLSEDSAPEPGALERILETVQRAPSVALAAPKLVDWDNPGQIVELGQSLTHRGDRWLLRRQELDQQQYDHMQDVLGVGPVGLLVRRDVWQHLDGFDPAYPVFDDGLDLSVRARLAGYRVVVSPASRVRFARLGVAGPRVDRSRSVMRTAHRQGRIAQLHRRISYAPALAAFFMWLGLPLVAVARVCWALIREHPGQMLGEFGSALRVFFTPASILASRRRIRAVNTAGWESVRPLRIDSKTVRTTRMIDREAILASQGRELRDLNFISTGGLAVLLTSVAVSLALTWWAISQVSLTGAAIAPLSPIGELWQATITQGGVPADPFAWVLAILGSLTFWNPSHAIVLLFILAIPAAALGGWIWGAQLTESKAGRALIGLGWALSPVLIGTLAAGRLPTIILAVVLPWLILAASRCRESWSWAGITSLLAAIALACAPVLIPAAVVLYVIGTLSSLRGITRVLSTAIAPLVLFAPKLVAMVDGSPLDLILDPGITPAFQPGGVWHLMLGFPEFGLAGWADIVDTLGLGGAPTTLLVGVLLLPIALLAVLGLFTGRVMVTVLNALLGGLGLATALASAQLLLLSEGSQSVAIWTGSGLALYWIGVLGLAATGCTVLGRAATPLVSVALVLALVAVAPLTMRLITDQTGLAPGDTQMPAIVQAAGEQDPTMRTLVVTAESESEVRAELITGPSLRLDQLRTAERSSEVTEEDQWVADLVGLLASTGESEPVAQALAENGVGFVLLNSVGDETARARFQGSLDQSTALSNAGQTSQGLLWRLQGETTQDESAVASMNTVSPLDGTTFSGRTIWIAQLIVLAGMLLLALPTGEVVERPARRRRPKKLKARPVVVQTVAPEENGASAESQVPVAAAGASEPATNADGVEVLEAPEGSEASEGSEAPEDSEGPDDLESPKPDAETSEEGEER